MAPTIQQMNQEGIQPYLRDEIVFQEALSRGKEPLKEFMLRQTRETDLAMFIEISDIPEPETVKDLPLFVLIPSFVISEFRIAFEMGCLLFIPFLMIDLVVASILLSTGMMMLPPVIISLPFKIMLFVIVDGWRLVVENVVSSFW